MHLTTNPVTRIQPARVAPSQVVWALRALRARGYFTAAYQLSEVALG